MLKYKKRLANYRLTNEVGNFYSFRSHGKPCSCFVCSTNKYKHNGTKKKEKKELNFELVQSDKIYLNGIEVPKDLIDPFEFKIA